MATKHVYLVRHGETADNRNAIHQSINVPLNALGKKQAAAAGKALASLPVGALITSDAERAQETAAAIAGATGTTARPERILRELHRGVLVIGTRHLGWQSIWHSIQLFIHANNPDWHSGDGENLIEFRERARQSLALLANEPGEHVVAVAHRGIINGIRYGVTHDFRGGVRRFIMHALLGHTKNGSITEFSYDPDRTPAWRLERTNDTRHLAGL